MSTSPATSEQPDRDTPPGASKRVDDAQFAALQRRVAALEAKLSSRERHERIERDKRATSLNHLWTRQGQNDAILTILRLALAIAVALVIGTMLVAIGAAIFGKE